MANRIQEILSWYGSDNPGTKTNIARLLRSGKLAGTGKLVILPVDQGFEHGPARSFAPNPPGYNPHYHFQLAIDAGCDALRLGCSAVGFTIYPGSAHCNAMYEQVRAIAEEAKASGLAVVVWSYPRGSSLSKEGETAMDVVAYAAQIAAQLGAHIIKVKLPTAHLEQAAAKKVYETEQIPIKILSERVKHVVQSAFDGRRIVIFSGGAKSEDQNMFEEARAIRDGGGFGSIIGRNSFQRPKAEAVKFLQTIMGIYAGEIQ